MKFTRCRSAFGLLAVLCMALALPMFAAPTAGPPPPVPSKVTVSDYHSVAATLPTVAPLASVRFTAQATATTTTIEPAILNITAAQPAPGRPTFYLATDNAPRGALPLGRCERYRQRYDMNPATSCSAEIRCWASATKRIIA